MCRLLEGPERGFSTDGVATLPADDGNLPWLLRVMEERKTKQQRATPDAHGP